MYSRLKNILEDFEEDLLSIKKDDETREVKEILYQSGIWESIYLLWNEVEKRKEIT